MDTARKKILIIDDDARNIFALSATLRARNYDCLSAPGARHGIELLEKHQDIGMVLMDMMMPEMDGYEALQSIRSKDDIKNVPVLAVTAQAMVGDREKCLEAGASDYISKPIDVDKLQHLLDKYMK